MSTTIKNPPVDASIPLNQSSKHCSWSQSDANQSAPYCVAVIYSNIGGISVKIQSNIYERTPLDTWIMSL